MAGSISLSLSQQFNSAGAPLNGGLLYTFAAGTTTPQSAYQDASLTLPWPNPIVLDSAGLVPPFYLADGQIKIRLADSAGVIQVSADNLLVVGASSGSGAAPSVDATTILATGDIKIRYGTGALSGFVRVNGRTIGSATSGGTERANADCEALFLYLWQTDANLSVSTGRGASAAADWAANKNIALPDAKGRLIAGMDDMGATAASRLTSTYFGTSAIVLGAVGGSESQTLTTAQLASHTHTGTTDQTGTDHSHLQNGTFTSSAMSVNATHTHTEMISNTTNATATGASSPGGTLMANAAFAQTAATNTDHTHNVTISGQTGFMSANHTHTFNSAASGSGSAHNNTQPTIVMTFYQKL